MLKNIHTIKVENAQTAISVTFFQKIKLLFGGNLFLYIDTQISESHGLMTVHLKPTIQDSKPDIKLKDNLCQGK